MIEPDNANSFIGSLIDRYSPPEEIFTVTLSGGEEFTFKPLTSLPEVNALKVGISQFAEMVRTKSCPPAWADYLTDDAATLTACYVIAHMSVEPKLTQLDCLKIANKAWRVIDELQRGIDDHQYRSGVVADAVAIEAKKNGSEPTTVTETGS